MRFLLISPLLISLAATEVPGATLTGSDQSEKAAQVTGRVEPETAPAAADPRRALEGWIESFNDDDEATREQWLIDNTILTPEQSKHMAGVDHRIRTTMGAFELLRVVRLDEHTIEVEARHSNGVDARIELTVLAEEPTRIANVQLQKVEPESDDGSE